MLELERVAVQAGAFALKPLSLEIPSGECHALLGPSGAGKSTVLELVVGFRPLCSGAIFLNGRDLARIPVERRRIGYLPQRLALFPHLTVRENILYGIRCRRRPGPADVQGVEALMESLGLSPLAHRKPTLLSGGERQRVALARALAPGPELLILDEPFSSLNASLRHELWRLLHHLQRRSAVTTLMVTHDLEEAFFLGDHVHVLIDGRLHQSGPRRSVFDRPATLDVARFLGIPNLFPAQVVRRDKRVAVLNLTTLGVELSLPEASLPEGYAARNGRLVVGIRPEWVAVAGGEGRTSTECLRLRGRVVEISERLNGTVIAFRPHGSAALVTAVVESQAAAALDRADLEVSLPVPHLFVLPAENPIRDGSAQAADVDDGSRP